MGLLGRGVTLLTVALFAVYLGNIVFAIISLFFPTFYFPYYNPRPASADSSTNGGGPVRYHTPFFQPDQRFHIDLYVQPRASSFQDLVRQRDRSQHRPLWSTTTTDGGSPLPLREIDFNLERNITWPVTFESHPVHGSLGDTKEEAAQELDAQGPQLTAVVYPDYVDWQNPETWQNRPDVLVTTVPLTVLAKRDLYTERNLLGDEATGTPAPSPNAVDASDTHPVPHWKSRLAIDLVNDRSHYPHSGVPGDYARSLRVALTTDDRPYLPLLGANPMATRREHLKPVADLAATSTDSGEDPTSSAAQWVFPLTLTIKTVPLGWYRLTRVLDASFAQLSAGQNPILGVSGNEVESLRKMIFEVNPTLLAITILAATLHLLFETLAVKADIAHWSRKANVRGISRSSVMMAAVTAWLSVLYVWDRRRDSGVLVLGGAVVSAVVESWKAMKLRRLLKREEHEACVDKAKPVEGAAGQNANEKTPLTDEDSLDPVAPTTDLAESERLSREYDDRIFWRLAYLCVPLIVGYAGYSLVYWKHRGIYSWALDTLMAAIYLLGFVNMTPQLFLNHRLRSVEAMSITTFVYRAINTFVDDLFALVIPMPGLTRASAFRDDIVFVVLLYQWWKFPKRAVQESEATEGKVKTE
ncbi:hypothetical protein IWQ60_007845 [Tieghemiomyces parasiticus]|uniref:Cleft lip and palate associated transmembrane protein n=1 Tax=Tieghemiomyces parasiticus TaxID=78921 RepID=A0A9W8A0E4_9FUNG|nr:hypothetical protein IWQ60_007845 [Tieghemiomyces parasiticus]